MQACKFTGLYPKIIGKYKSINILHFEFIIKLIIK